MIPYQNPSHPEALPTNGKGRGLVPGSTYAVNDFPSPLECSARCPTAVRVGRVIGESVTRWSHAGHRAVHAISRSLPERNVQDT